MLNNHQIIFFYLVWFHQCQRWHGAGLFLLKWLGFSVPNFIDRSFSWWMPTAEIKEILESLRFSFSGIRLSNKWTLPLWGRKMNTPSNDTRFSADWTVTVDVMEAKSPTFIKELIYNSSAMASGGSDFWQIDGAPKWLWRVYQNSLDFPSGRHCKKALVIVSC